MNILLAMSLAGSLGLMGYLFFYPIRVKFLSADRNYSFLKIIMFLFIVPFQYFKRTYDELISRLCNFFYLSASTENVKVESININRTIFVSSDGSSEIRNQEIYVALVSIWVFIVLIWILTRIRQYFYFRRIIVQTSLRVKEHNLEIFEDCCREMKLKCERIRILMNDGIDTPFAVGVFRPYIVLPGCVCKRDDLRMIIFHELSHIKNHDLIFRLMTIAIMVVHFFNPLTFFFYYELVKAAEWASDEKVLEMIGREKVTDYGILLIEMAGMKKNSQFSLTVGFKTEAAKSLERRINFMKRLPTSKTKMMICSLAMMVVLFWALPVSVKAYTPMNIFASYTPETDLGDVDTAQDLVFVPIELRGKAEVDFAPNDYYVIKYDFQLGDAFFVDADGQCYLLEEGKTTRAGCVHDFQYGDIYRHQKNGAGCTVTQYYGKKCSKCSYYEQINVKGTFSYTICPH